MLSSAQFLHCNFIDFIKLNIYESKEVKAVSAIPSRLRIAPLVVQKDKNLPEYWHDVNRGVEFIIQKVEIINTFFMCL